jgi:hypothetical protein
MGSTVELALLTQISEIVAINGVFELQFRSSEQSNPHLD